MLAWVAKRNYPLIRSSHIMACETYYYMQKKKKNQGTYEMIS